MPTLLYCDVDGVDRTYELGPQPVMIGRAADCGIRSDDPRMSRQHARISFDGQAIWVEDLGSANGVFVGRDRVNVAPLPTGEVALVGSLLIQVLGAQGALPPTGGVHAQLSHWLAMERKTRAAIEDERTALAKRVGELISEMNTQARAASNELTAVLLQRDEAMNRAERIEEQVGTLEDELVVARAAPRANAEDKIAREKLAAAQAELEQLKGQLRELTRAGEEAEERFGEATAERDRVREELEAAVAERTRLADALEAMRSAAEHAASEQVTAVTGVRAEAVAMAVDAERARLTAEAEAERVRLLAEAATERERLIADAAAERDKQAKAAALERDKLIAEATGARDRALAEQKARHEAELSEHRKELARLNDELLMAETQAGVMVAEKQAVAERRISALETELNAARRAGGADRLAEASDKLAAAETRLTELNVQLTDARAKAADAERRAADSDQRALAADERVTSALERAFAAEGRVAEIEAQLAQDHDGGGDAEAQLVQATASARASEQRVDELERELAEARAALVTAGDEHVEMLRRAEEERAELTRRADDGELAIGKHLAVSRQLDEALAKLTFAETAMRAKSSGQATADIELREATDRRLAAEAAAKAAE